LTIDAKNHVKSNPISTSFHSVPIQVALTSIISEMPFQRLVEDITYMKESKLVVLLKEL